MRNPKRAVLPCDAAPERTLVMAVQATGSIVGLDELLSMTIVDGTGRTLFDERLKPVRHRNWDGTQLTWEDVRGCMTLRDRSIEVQTILEGADLLLVEDFDTVLRILEGEGIRFNLTATSVTTQYKRVYYDAVINIKTIAAGYGFTSSGRTTLDAARDALRCWQAMLQDPVYQRIGEFDRDRQRSQTRWHNVGCGFKLGCLLLYLIVVGGALWLTQVASEETFAAFYHLLFG